MAIPAPRDRLHARRESHGVLADLILAKVEADDLPNDVLVKPEG